MITETGSGGEKKLENANQKWQARREIGHGLKGFGRIINIQEKPVTNVETRKALEQATNVLQWVEDTIE